MNRPTFFLAGNSKSGTTALYRFLQAHPQLFLCTPKEPNYFCHDLNLDPEPGHHFHQQPLEAYLALFREAAPGQRCGEASAVYLYSSEAAAAIRRFEPEARLVVVLREPVDFLRSYHQQLLRNPPWDGESVKDLAEALALEPARRRGEHLPPGCRVPPLLYYRERVRYADHLQRLFDVFDRRQVLVLLYDDFARDNAAQYRRVLSFLGVDPDFAPAFAVHNPGADVRSQSLHRWLGRVAKGEGWTGPVHRGVKALLPRPLRHRLLRAASQRLAFRPRRPLDPALVGSLKAHFRDDVVRLSALLDVDLVARWGYDAVPQSVHEEAS